MKQYTKIALLVALALILTLTACNRSASKPPVTVPTSTGEAPFPYTTSSGGVSDFGTQTAVALTPQAAITNTPQVILATDTPSSDAQSGGGSTSGSDSQAGGGGGGNSSAAAVNTPVVARPASYVLQKGEWPICIARRYNLDISSFFSANGLNMNSKPATGVTLKIPASGNWSANYGKRTYNAHPATHKVAAGETVYTIACHYGDVAPETILAVNGLSSASDVKSGMSLNIP